MASSRVATSEQDPPWSGPRNNRVADAILSFGGFLGLGDRHFAIPWEALSFDLSQKVAVLDIDKDR